MTVEDRHAELKPNNSKNGLDVLEENTERCHHVFSLVSSRGHWQGAKFN